MADRQINCRIYMWHGSYCVSGEMLIEEEKEENEEEEDEEEEEKRKKRKKMKRN